ncbi:GDSL esterase/lipase at1g71691 [Phtheirospermum japonicum]|uniref:GDSL esterase/lipase at1g71691 n=1 Tax=Phtheirospermum japonicum TaxID=374723 RepID=A0A830B135_9LAMI|nr:GDSL esterase/lipase at1g71691 [Phtheirospermum japonicum]
MADKKLRFYGLCLILLVSSANNASVARGQIDAFAPEASQRRRQLVPAIFVFGDSLSDNGNNNNFLISFAKANYFPYGIDFSSGPTGRFSNGYIMADAIAELLGLPLIPPHSGATVEQMRYGVNFASAAAGILDITGRNFVTLIPFIEQINNFENTLEQMTDSLGVPDLGQALARSIFFIAIGSNDYLNNYLMPNYATRNQYNAQQFADLLIQQYTSQITRLYRLGARRFAIAGLGLLGCIPSVLSQGNEGICSEEVNQLVHPFNINIKSMIHNLTTNLPDALFSYIDIHNIMQDLVDNSRSYGFNVVNRGCCGTGRNRGQLTCLPFQTPCPDRNQYIFWDAYHPTEAVNILLGQRAFNGSTDYVYPINIERLATL